MNEIKKAVKECAQNIRKKAMVKDADEKLYEDLAILYIYHCSAGLTHEKAAGRSIARLHGNGMSRDNMVKAAHDTIRKQQNIITHVRGLMGE